MAIARVESDRFPYLPLTLVVVGRAAALQALLDTGFDGDIVVPPSFVRAGPSPDEYTSWELADGSVVATPVYHGIVRVGDLAPVEADIVLLGEEPIVGRGITDHYRVILDHGERVIAEP